MGTLTTARFLILGGKLKTVCDCNNNYFLKCYFYINILIFFLFLILTNLNNLKKLKN